MSTHARAFGARRTRILSGVLVVPTALAVALTASPADAKRAAGDVVTGSLTLTTDGESLGEFDGDLRLRNNGETSDASVGLGAPGRGLLFDVRVNGVSYQIASQEVAGPDGVPEAIAELWLDTDTSHCAGDPAISLCAELPDSMNPANTAIRSIEVYSGSPYTNEETGVTVLPGSLLGSWSQ